MKRNRTQRFVLVSAIHVVLGAIVVACGLTDHPTCR